jgi:hypothetical protein
MSGSTCTPREALRGETAVTEDAAPRASRAGLADIDERAVFM